MKIWAALATAVACFAILGGSGRAGAMLRELGLI
jgi:hypothetical protein